MEENQRVKEAFYHTLRCEEDAELERVRTTIILVIGIVYYFHCNQAP